MKREVVASAGIFLIVLASVLLWHRVSTVLRDAAAQVAEIRKAAPVTNSISDSSIIVESTPAPLMESIESPQISDDLTQLDFESNRRRLNKFFLERYYPDLQKETDFSSDDINTLIRLKGSDEAVLYEGLGAAKYQRWKEYEAKVDSSAAVGRLGRKLSGKDRLREDQVEMLYRAIADEQLRRNEELRIRTQAAPSDLRLRLEFEFTKLEIREESDRRLIFLAKLFLTERQIALFPEAVFDPNLADRRENLEYVRERMESGSAR